MGRMEKGNETSGKHARGANAANEEEKARAVAADGTGNTVQEAEAGCG